MNLKLIKTISDEEKLIVTVKGGQSKNKDVKTFNIPKKAK